MTDPRKSDENDVFPVSVAVALVMLLFIFWARGCAFAQVASSCTNGGSWTHLKIMELDQGYHCTPVVKEETP
jgi:hypothetical protein